ncbi:lipocalin/fatty-acid binding family protein [Kitasatospora sp. NPDC002040]|uniref:lipocalin/fatty-acid binding family protein n=1 Tax=Kitasatospora sp. NPDC002040 TaxID=3154661 RepID=UPI003332B5FC
MSFAGKYEMTSSDNFEEYLKAVGVGFATRKLAASSKPTVELTEDGDAFTLKTTTTFKTITLAFTLGQEFAEETDDGRKVPTTIVRDGNKLVQQQHLDGLIATITRTFTADGLEATFEADGVVSKRSYKRV